MPQRIRQLTELSVEQARPANGRRELPDGGGLYLIIHPSGTKNWAVRYRHNGRTRKYTIPGTFPAIGLKSARGFAKEALERVAGGGDPGAEKIAARRRGPANGSDYPALAAMFLDRWLKKSGQRPRARTIEAVAHLLGFARKDGAWMAKPGGLALKWRGRPIGDIGRAEIVDVLDALVTKTPIKANRTRAALHRFFGWCVRRGALEHNPVAATEMPAPARARDRVLSDAELILLWQAASDDPLFGPLYRFLVLTGQRRDEARGATWDEIDLRSAIWTIPAARAKNGRQHEVPLSAPAVALLNAQPRIAKRGGLIFTTTGKTGLSGLSRAKERLERRMGELAEKSRFRGPIPQWGLHDLRRTCATGLQRLGVAREVIERILNHASGGFAGVAGIYQRHNFADEKRAALDAWARRVEELVKAAAQ